VGKGAKKDGDVEWVGGEEKEEKVKEEPHVTLLKVLMMTRQSVTRRTMRAGTTSVGIRKETLRRGEQ